MNVPGTIMYAGEFPEGTVEKFYFVQVSSGIYVVERSFRNVFDVVAYIFKADQ